MQNDEQLRILGEKMAQQFTDARVKVRMLNINKGKVQARQLRWWVELTKWERDELTQTFTAILGHANDIESKAGPKVLNRLKRQMY
jgi:hypothetical protein